MMSTQARGEAGPRDRAHPLVLQHRGRPESRCLLRPRRRRRPATSGTEARETARARLLHGGPALPRLQNLPLCKRAARVNKRAGTASFWKNRSVETLSRAHLYVENHPLLREDRQARLSPLTTSEGISDEIVLVLRFMNVLSRQSGVGGTSSAWRSAVQVNVEGLGYFDAAVLSGMLCRIIWRNYWPRCHGAASQSQGG